MTLKSQIVDLAVAGLSDVRCAGIVLSLEDLIERPKHGGGIPQYRIQRRSDDTYITSLSELAAEITLAKVGIVVTVAALLNNYLMANFGFSILSLNAILISLAVAAVAFGIVSYMNQKELTKDFTFKEIGADIAKKYRETEQIINSIQAHHGDVEPTSVEAVLVAAADAISAARPGARRETLESYLKRLTRLEEISESFAGVEKCFDVQAGREIRIMVKPDQIDDAESVLLARDIAKKIEAEMEYPGQIKVIIIRETRAVDYAK